MVNPSTAFYYAPGETEKARQLGSADMKSYQFQQGIQFKRLADHCPYTAPYHCFWNNTPGGHDEERGLGRANVGIIFNHKEYSACRH
jgi:hypothetical protein